jgi:hypothetical protein
MELRDPGWDAAFNFMPYASQTTIQYMAGNNS